MTRSPGRKGAVAALSAVVMVPVLGFAGLAIDVTRLWMVNARLKTAIDAAALVAARQISLNATERDGQAQAVYWMNFTQNGRTPNYMGATLQDLQVATIPGNANRISVSGSARVRTTLFSLISDQTTQVGDASSAEVLGNGIELALVMDQTKSMREPAPGFASKLDAAQAATRTLLNILYGSRDVQPNVFVSVVPFARTVNIGRNNTGVLDTTNMPSGWDINRWYGCVEARRNGDNDIRDLGPGDAGGRLRPYFYQSTFRRVGWVDNKPSNTIVNLSVNATAWRNATGVDPYSGADACNKDDAYSEITINLRETAGAANTKAFNVRFCHGDNDWTHPSLANAGNAEFDFLVDVRNMLGVGETPENAAGRNRLCAMTPILPLTASRATVQARIDAITAPRETGGTTIVTGMQGAWYALSPRWQGYWPGIANSPQYGALPLPYNTRNVVKAVVLLSDGDNNWWPRWEWREVRSSPSGDEYMYNAYGRIADWNANFPSDQISTNPDHQGSSADPALDRRLSAICTAMKAAGIRIYVVGFEIRNNTHRNLLRNCATEPDEPYFMEAPTASDLNNAFSTIANQLVRLRLTE